MESFWRKKAGVGVDLMQLLKIYLGKTENKNEEI